MALVLVTGGTGTLGRLLVTRLDDADHDVRILSRRPGPGPERPLRAGSTGPERPLRAGSTGPGLFQGDLRTGEGLDAAVAGVVPAFGKSAAAFKGGANLCPDNAEGRITWEQWLASRYGSQR